ncbi:hypothetical protein [Gloeothece verrucosa]|uniref:Uncharacterized protein n=1 Tax=Gloeothece verrucosa (strain PCC 7822) TaxID=497965 RepID=E0U7W6_GLOV7|nr:hypothetical protein [Gloeothece verrucosa]ADN16053.1 hypothetical protein Cyan7822_4135 [Gloeothece verrucosa PCC 7822]
MPIVNEYEEEMIAILLQEENFYPWNPADPEAEDYFEQQQKSWPPFESLELEQLPKIELWQSI